MTAGPKADTVVGGDDKQAPVIQPNYLQDPRDLELMLEGVRLAREIFLQPGFDSYRNGFIFPEKSDPNKDEQIDFIRRDIGKCNGRCEEEDQKCQNKSIHKKPRRVDIHVHHLHLF